MQICLLWKLKNNFNFAVQITMLFFFARYSLQNTLQKFKIMNKAKILKNFAFCKVFFTKCLAEKITPYFGAVYLQIIFVIFYNKYSFKTVYCKKIKLYFCGSNMLAIFWLFNGIWVSLAPQAKKIIMGRVGKDKNL